MNGRLSALDDSFLAVENASAHMHVGWAATFRPPEGREAPRFDELRDHIASKAHHCMVDGIAAVEMASLLLDPTPNPPPEESDGWLPSRPPGAARRLLGGILDLVVEEVSLMRYPVRFLRYPGRLGELVS